MSWGVFVSLVVFPTGHAAVAVSAFRAIPFCRSIPWHPLPSSFFTESLPSRSFPRIIPPAAQHHIPLRLRLFSIPHFCCSRYRLSPGTSTCSTMPSPMAFLPGSAWAPGRASSGASSTSSVCRQRPGPAAPVMVAQEDLSEGMKVRVSVPTLMYHVPKRGGKPMDLQGMTGSVKKVVGGGISANRPVVVQFTEPKFFGHFDAAELELVEEE